MEQGDRQVLPRYGCIETCLQLDLNRKPTTGKTFMNAPWLVAEAYKYRRLRECFAVSKFWRDYDVFFRQKVSTGMMTTPP